MANAAGRLAYRLLGSDRHMRIRVWMTSVSALISALCGALVLLLAYAGFAPVLYTWIWLGVMVLFNTGTLLAYVLATRAV